MIKQDLDKERVDQGKYYFGIHYGDKNWGEYEQWLFQEGLIPVKHISKEELEKLYPRRNP